MALSQFLIYWVYVLPNVEEGIVLSGSLWWLFILDTIVIAASGYVINDIFDIKADRHNKPEKIFVGEGQLTSKSAIGYYLFLVFIGFVIAGFIAYSIDKIHLLVIYPVAVILLFFYSYRFKKQPLIGNVVVAIFCAFVPGIIWYAESDVLSILSETEIYKYELIINLFVAYISFAFFSTMVREIVKDIEDKNGDMESGYKTLPIVTSSKGAKIIAVLFCVGLLLSYALWFRGFDRFQLPIIGLLVGALMVVPTMIILVKLCKAQDRSDYTIISKWLKILMVISLFVFLCIPYLSIAI